MVNEKDLESTVVFYFILFFYSLMFGLDNSIPGSASSDWNFFFIFNLLFFSHFIYLFYQTLRITALGWDTL